jgi:sec-independent protein translocase protein TatA
MFRSPLADGLVVLVVLLLFFGPKRLPMLSRSVGESIKEFKGGIADASGSDDKQALSPGQAPVTETRTPVDTGVERSS